MYIYVKSCNVAKFMLHRIKWHNKKTEILVDSYSNTMMYEVISDNMPVAKTFIDDFAFL